MMNHSDPIIIMLCALQTYFRNAAALRQKGLLIADHRTGSLRRTDENSIAR